MNSKIPIFYIVIANLLWSFIPVVVFDLFNDISTIMVIFLRFFTAGLIFFGISTLILIYNNNFTKNARIPFRSFLKVLLYKNEAFLNLRNLIYFSLIGFFGIILQIIGFFMALKTTSIGLTMIGFQISIILVAFYEHGVRSERLDFFKILYLLLLVVTIGIIIFVKSQELKSAESNFSVEGLAFILIFSLSLTFLHIGMSKETYDKNEFKLLNKNHLYKTFRLNFKLSIIFLLGITIMIPFLLILLFIPIQGSLQIEIMKFFNEFSVFFQILARWEILFLIFLATIIPFSLLFLARIKWSSYNLTYSQWSSILTIIEPIGAIFFGVLIINEYFPLEFLTIVIFLLIISILFRYAHESKNKVNALIVLNKKPGNLKNLPLDLLKINGICCVDSILGTHDLVLNVKTNSIKDLYYLIDTHIRNQEAIIGVKILFINKIHKLNN